MCMPIPYAISPLTPILSRWKDEAYTTPRINIHKNLRSLNSVLKQCCFTMKPPPFGADYMSLIDMAACSRGRRSGPTSTPWAHTLPSPPLPIPIHIAYCLLVPRLTGRTYKMSVVCQSASQSACNHFFSESAPTIFLISCMKLGVHKRKKVMEPDFSGKPPFAQIWAKRAQNGPKLDSLDLFSRLPPRIFLVSCMKLGGYKGYKG